MNIIQLFIDFILHLDVNLAILIQALGNWSYAFLFGIIFCETGLVITPFLPGDSLLFAAGALAALGSFKIWLLWFILCIAAILGDTVNYWIGYWIGESIIHSKSKWIHKIIKKEYLDRTHEYFNKYGGETIIIARFIPIIRTFAPFIAGIGEMKYWKFISYNIIGGIVWVSLFLFGGYFFGNLPFVKEHFGLVVIAIIIISFIPLAYEFWKFRKESKKEKKK